MKPVALAAMYRTCAEGYGLEVKACPRCGCVEIVKKVNLRWFAWDRVFAARSVEVCGRLARQTEAGVYHRRSTDWWGLPAGV